MSKITKEVILSCIAGDRRSQHFFYETLRGKLFGIIYNRINDKNDTDTILNIAFTRIFKKLHTFSFQGQFEAWCVIITKHAIIDYYKQKREETLSIEEYQNTHLHGDDYFEYFTGNLTPSVNQGETNTVVDDYFNLLKQLLTDREYRIFMLTYEGYTHKEIGKIMNITEGTSKWYLYTLREKIQQNETFKKITH